MILLTGVMRSGTSALSKMLHQSGVDMGSIFVAPPPATTLELEYEDAELTMFLYSTPTASQAEAFFRDYIRRRRKEKRTAEWGVKSPFLLPYIEQIEKICNQFGEPLITIFTMRPFDESIESLGRAKVALGFDDEWLQDRIEHNSALAQCVMQTVPDIVITYEKIRNTPAMALQEIQSQFSLLIDIERGVEGIKKIETPDSAPN